MYKSSDILLIEDNPGDVRLIQEFFKEHKIANTLTIVKDCTEALSFLRQQETYVQATRPDLIIISVHILLLTEDKVLKQFQDIATQQSIPIVGLTDSPVEDDWIGDNLPIKLSIPKPLTAEKFLRIAKYFGSFRLAFF
jgi:two-component system, chemotaxis family, response regulator Rcp1